MIRSCLAASLTLVIAGADAAPFDGRWAMTIGDCGVAPGMSDRVPLSIAGDTFEAYEGRCVIASLEAIGAQEAAWRVTRTCSGEGETWTVSSIFAIDRDATGAPRQLVEINLDEGFVIVRQHCN